MKLVRILLGILIPPVGVFLAYGLSVTLLINILLTVLGWVPGIIHAVWAIVKYEEKAKYEKYEEEARQQEGTV